MPTAYSVRLIPPSRKGQFLDEHQLTAYHEEP